MPGVNANDARQIARVEMVFKSALFLSDNIEAALALECFERRRQRLKLGARALRLLIVDGAREHLDIFPTIVASPNLRDAPLAAIAFDEAKRRLDLRHDRCR